MVFTGTIVTASGPHAGDSQAARLDFFLPDVARLHGASVVVLAALALALAWGLRRTHAPPPVQRSARVLLVVLAAQAAVGYTQYFTGVPALLVGVHVLGAVVVWTAVVSLNLAVSAPVATPPVGPPPPAPSADATVLAAS